MSGEIDFAGASRALSAVLAGEARIAEAAAQADAARGKADDELRSSRAQAEQTCAQTIAQGRAALEQQCGSARAQAQQLAGQQVPGLAEYAVSMGVPANVGWAGGTPREVAELHRQFDSLRQRGETIRFINELDVARLSGRKPVLRWVWLGITALGAISILFL